MEYLVLGIVDDIIFWVQFLWWLWLFVVAYFLYAWARDHLGFSPLLTLTVAGILIFYLVFEHPIFGSMGLLLYGLIYGGLLFLLPLVLPFFKRRP
ncbi:MAG: hypothetical protein V1835_06525 [Candidatus Micrarchaeota archaeon]